MNVYVDSSAFVKLISLEPETDALLQWLGEHRPSLFASELLRTEVIRAVQEYDSLFIDPSISQAVTEKAELVVDGIDAEKLSKVASVVVH